MKPQAAIGDVVFVKIAKNPTLANIEAVFQENDFIFTGFGISKGWINKLKVLIATMSEFGYKYRDYDPTLKFGKFTDQELKMITEFSQPYVTIRDSNQNYFYVNAEDEIVNIRGHICTILAVRVTFGDMYAPIIVPYDEIHKIREHVRTFSRQIQEYKETVYYQLSDRYGNKPVKGQEPVLFFHVGEEIQL